MNYTLMPSLERRALIKTAITLWNSDAINLDDIRWRDEKWIAEDHVIGKVKALPIPESLKKMISGFIKPIGFEILKWINHYQNFLLDDQDVYDVESRENLEDVKKVGKSLSKLCWTPQGTVDRKKTAEELIRDDNLDITERYKLACMYCLRNDILKLWNNMPEYCRKDFYSEEDPRAVAHQNELVFCWTYDIKGELTRTNDIFNEIERVAWYENEFVWDCIGCTPYDFLFLHAVEYRNKVATEYFWQKVTSEKRKELLATAVPIISASFSLLEEDGWDVLFFLLSQMNEEQQSEVLKEPCIEVPERLLDWPWQDFFMETANHVWPFLSEYHYFWVLRKFLFKVKYGYKDYDYKKLFMEFWQQSSITLKEYVRDNVRELLCFLNEIEDKDYFKIIFASIPAGEKFLFSEKGKSLLVSLIYNDKMDLLDVFVRECISSKHVIKFREEFENFIIHNHSNIKKTKEEKLFSKFFQLLDELIEDNRKHVDERNTNLPANRLCSHNK